MTDRAAGAGRIAVVLVWVAAIVLFALHQDCWYWDDATLVFGFLPIGLFYHAVYSLAAGCLWACAVRWAWPRRIERWADEPDHSERTS